MYIWSGFSKVTYCNFNIEQINKVVGYKTNFAHCLMYDYFFVIKIERLAINLIL